MWRFVDVRSWSWQGLVEVGIGYPAAVARRADPARGETARLEVAVSDCRRILRHGCGSCPSAPRCVLLRRLFRRLDCALGFRERANMMLRTIRFVVDGERAFATLVKVDHRGAIYQVSARAGPTLVTVPLEEASGETTLAAYLEGQVRLGRGGVQLLQEG